MEDSGYMGGQREEQKVKKPLQGGSKQRTTNSHQNGSVPSYSYYYPAYDASDYYNQPYYLPANTIDSHYPVVQTDGSIVYVMPGVYSSYMPVSVDGQYVGQQVYPSVQSPEYSLASLPNGDLVQTPYYWNTSNLLVADPRFANGFVATAPSKHNYSSATTVPPKSSKLSNPLSLDLISRNDKHKPFNKPASHVHSDSASQGVTIPYHNQGSSGVLYSNNSEVSVKARTNLVDSAKMVNEKNPNGSTDDSKSSGEATCEVKREQYNLAEFSTKYEDALFFVIKSYSEDDIHKSIKYNVWASTPNGNNRLSLAFQEAQDKLAKTGTKCPIFLFFSVNASGQFCGVAEMTGQVDFSKNMNFWQQSKWNGYFPVKWHIIKDIPNSQLRHVILQNNENKPVTNSRDTQEVKFHQGIDVLNVFKNYTSATSILDDFDFYENRQNIMQEKRLRQSVNHHDLQVKVGELTTGIESVNLTTDKKA